jgi:cell division protein FtsQ
VLWVLGVVTVVTVAAVAAASSPWLDVEEVEVIGVGPERAAEVRRASGIDRGDSMVTFIPGSVAARIRDLPWVADATVTRDLPSTVRIEIASRVPVGWVRARTGVLVVDASAQVLWRADDPPAGVPELLGVADVAPPGGRIAPAVLARVAGELGPDLRLRSMAVTLDDGAVTVRVRAGPEIRFGAPRRVPMKARVASAVLESLGPAPARYIDVTVPAAPVSG